MSLQNGVSDKVSSVNCHLCFLLVAMNKLNKGLFGERLERIQFA